MRNSLRRPIWKALLAAGLLLALVLALSIYIGVTAGSDLFAARSALTGSAVDLNDEAIAEARAHLSSAMERLDSWPARILRLVPIARQNLEAARAAARGTLPVLDRASELSAELEAIQDAHLIREGRVDLERLERLEEPLRRQTAAFEGLKQELRKARSGWLLPPVWDALDRLIERVDGYGRAAAVGAEGVGVAATLLGQQEPRSYLVILMNNAELRGAGGIPSGIGTLSVDEGRLRLGRFRYTTELRDRRPYERVDAPADFTQRFGRFAADTRLWVNTTFSPDVPDVALVASRLFEASTGRATNGVILIDPRGMAALMPPGSSVRLPGVDRTVAAQDIPEFVYSEAYDEFPRRASRRDLLLGMGRAVFQQIIAGGFGSRDGLASAADAIAGRHLAFVSFDPAEAELLDDLGVSADLMSPKDAGLHVSVQNFGGDKLDFWASRHIEHVCDIDPPRVVCETTVTVANQAPPGLTRYVAGIPNPRKAGSARLISRVDIHLPAAADTSAITVDGGSAVHLLEEEDGLRVVEVPIEAEPGEVRKVSVTYTMPVERDGPLRFDLIPQPLARDATLDLRLQTHGGWTVRGLGDVRSDVDWQGDFTRSIELVAGRDGRNGLPGAWRGLVNFWREPLF